MSIENSSHICVEYLRLEWNRLDANPKLISARYGSFGPRPFSPSLPLFMSPLMPRPTSVWLAKDFHDGEGRHAVGNVGKRIEEFSNVWRKLIILDEQYI